MREHPSFGRRTFLSGASAFAGGLLLADALADVPPRAGIRAILFDAFPIFDPRPVFQKVELRVPDRGVELARLWRDRQFEYTWLRALSGRYVDFWHVTEDALDYSAKLLKLDLSDETRSELMSTYLNLKAWPDVPNALMQLKSAGFGLAFLSNFTPAMLKANISSAWLDGLFSQVLSTDAVRSYKPDPRAYRIGIDAIGLPVNEILFVPFAGWDAAGAKAFGYSTFWVNRLGLPPEKLGDMPDGTGSGLNDVVKFLGV